MPSDGPAPRGAGAVRFEARMFWAGVSGLWRSNGRCGSMRRRGEGGAECRPLLDRLDARRAALPSLLLSVTGFLPRVFRSDSPEGRGFER